MLKSNPLLLLLTLTKLAMSGPTVEYTTFPLPRHAWGTGPAYPVAHVGLCAHLCRQNEPCSSVKFNRETGTCTLLGGGITVPLPLTSADRSAIPDETMMIRAATIRPGNINTTFELCASACLC